MNRTLLPFLLFIVSWSMVGCHSGEMLTQTPDDVYFSPAKAEEGTKYSKRKEMHSDPLDRQWTMSKYNRRWRYMDDYDRMYDPYRYGYGYGYYYNPYYAPYPVFNPHLTDIQPKSGPVRMSNLTSYHFQQATVNPKGNQGPVRFSQPIRNYNNSNREPSSTREVFTPSFNSGGSTRSYQPSGNSGSSSGSSISRPARN